MTKRRYEPDPRMEVLSRFHGTMSVLDAQHREAVWDRLADRPVPVKEFGIACDVMQAAAVLLGQCRGVGMLGIPRAWADVGEDPGAAFDGVVEDLHVYVGVEGAAEMVEPQKLAVATALVKAALAVIGGEYAAE